MTRGQLYYFFMLALIGFLSGCAITSNPYNEPLPIGFPYYGFLPGDDFKIYDSQKKFDFVNKTIGFELIDARGSNKNAQCIGFELDRNTELEGNRGMGLVSEYFGAKFRPIDGASYVGLKVAVQSH